MATATAVIPEKDIKVEVSSRKDDVKVTNLLSEIRTTELPKETPMQVDNGKEEKSKPVSIEGEESKGGDNETNEDKDKQEKGDKNLEEVDKADSKEIKGEGVEKLKNGENKGEDKKVDNGEKKSENIDKKADDNKTVDKSSNKPGEEKKVVNEDRKDGSRRSPKKEKESPLAGYFQNWDKFTTNQKLDIERFIREKAIELGAPPKLKRGVRTMTARERSYYKWSAMRRRIDSRREPLRFRRRPSRDRRIPSRLRGAGDSRYNRESRRWSRYSPRRETFPWRSPWTPQASPVESLMKQMQRFVEMVDRIPAASTMVRTIQPPRMALLPTPPNGYISARVNRLRDEPIHDKPRDYAESPIAPSQRWPDPPFLAKSEDSSQRLYGKEPSSKSLPKPRPSPYSSRGDYSATVFRNDVWSSNRERNFSRAASAKPFQESRLSYAATYRR